jgi:hypothetical protein
MLNLWEVAPEDVSLAFSLKDTYLELDHKVNSKKWEGQPVVIVDIDDVLAEFRTPFADFLSRVYDIEADVESDQYFFVEDILKASGNINPEKVFESSIKFAVDDSPKHALEYAEHGMSVMVPVKSYNKHIKNENITFYNDIKEIIGG